VDASLLYTKGLINEDQLFRHLFSPASLHECFVEKHSRSRAKGLDRITGPQYRDRAYDELAVASRKCIDGTLSFTPYQEVLKPKGRGKPPREISVPTVRDRTVLSQLLRFISLVFPECVPKSIAHTYVKQMSETLTSAPDDAWVCCLDIRNFYDNIRWPQLGKILSSRIDSPSALKLIGVALKTPTVPKGTARSKRQDHRRRRGVPQGLAISNLLAAIYLKSVDDFMAAQAVSYQRYVDDVVLVGSSAALDAASKRLASRLRVRGLSLHPEDSPKTHLAPKADPFEYLGYRFVYPKIGVRESTVERFLQSIVAKFSDYKYNKASKLSRYAYLSEEILKNAFLMELNERITGAVSGGRRYGWIAYFSQINDPQILFRIDAVIENLFSRLSDFKFAAPKGLKRIARAHWEIRYDIYGGYVRNYDVIVTVEQKIEFLVARGRMGPGEILTVAQIGERYDAYLTRQLADMHADEAAMY